MLATGVESAGAGRAERSPPCTPVVVGFSSCQHLLVFLCLPSSLPRTENTCNSNSFCFTPAVFHFLCSFPRNENSSARTPFWHLKPVTLVRSARQLCAELGYWLSEDLFGCVYVEKGIETSIYIYIYHYIIYLISANILNKNTSREWISFEQCGGCFSWSCTPTCILATTLCLANRFQVKLLRSFSTLRCWFEESEGKSLNKFLKNLKDGRTLVHNDHNSRQTWDVSPQSLSAIKSRYAEENPGSWPLNFWEVGCHATIRIPKKSRMATSGIMWAQILYR